MKESKFKTTNPEKILFPKSKFTKADLLAYYEKVSKRMIPLIKDRPLTMHRFPNGIDKEGFIQKNISAFFPSWVKSVTIERKEEESIKMVIANDLDTLLYIVNLACITLHVWTSRVKKIHYPDRMIFDLDPGKKSFKSVVQAAKDLKVMLDKLDLPAFLMTTGSRGLHVVVPLKPSMEYDDVKHCAYHIATLLSQKFPKKYTVEQRKESRKGKLFIDYMRNAYGQMAVAPYAVRAIEGAPIATPIDWKELDTPGFSSQAFTLKNIGKRLKKKCPWESIDAKAKSLKSVKNISVDSEAA